MAHAKTIEFIHQNVKVDAVRDDLETLVLDADMLDAVIRDGDPARSRATHLGEQSETSRDLLDHLATLRGERGVARTERPRPLACDHRCLFESLPQRATATSLAS